jgi:hypothetical protein
MANGKTDATAKTAGKPAEPQQRWWQWILIYPTLGVSLFSAAPQWVDQLKAAYYEVRNDSYELALRENALWKKNLSCATAPYAWYENPKDVRVDATICNSGDVFVRASSPGGQEVTKWVAVEDMFPSASEGSGEGSGLIPAAKAATIEPGRMQAGSEDFADFSTNQYQNVFVICQRFVDGRMLLRHVRAENGICYDELIDTFNGSLAKRTQVTCRQSC